MLMESEFAVGQRVEIQTDRASWVEGKVSSIHPCSGEITVLDDDGYSWTGPEDLASAV